MGSPSEGGRNGMPERGSGRVDATLGEGDGTLNAELRMTG